MIMRRRMMARRVVGVAATTAVVAGTAGAVRHHQDQRYANQAAEQQAQYEASQPQPPMEQAQAAPSNDMMAQLNQLSQMHAAGILSDDEFAAAKQKVLAAG